MPKNNQVSIEDIFQVFRDGASQQGAALLYRHYYKTMYGIAFSVLKRDDDCQDVIHNIVCKFLRLDASKFPDNHGLSWLYTVTKNEALMFLRKEPALESVDEISAIVEEDKNIRDYVDMDSYYAMISGLNDVQKQVVTLKVLGGCTHREIAEMLGKPVGTIQWIYNSSIKKLKILLSVLFAATVFAWAKCISKIVDYVLLRNSSPNVSIEANQIQLEVAIVFYGFLAVLLSIVFWVKRIKQKKMMSNTNKCGV